MPAEFRFHFMAASRVLTKATEQATNNPCVWTPETVEYWNIVRDQVARLEKLRLAARN